MRRLFRIFKEGFIGFFRHFSVSLSSVAVVTFTMLFLGVILLITDNIVNLTKTIESGIEVWVPIAREHEEEYEQIQADLLNNPLVLEVQYITKEEDLQQYIDDRGEEYEFLQEEGQENPLLDSFIIRSVDGQSLQTLVSELQNEKWPDSIHDGGQQTINLVKSLEAIRLGGALLIIALLLLAVFLISNTIKLSIHSRQDEIEIMRIVGATNGFITGPFLIEGLLIGLLGSLIPISVVYFGYQYLVQQSQIDLLLFGTSLSPMFPLVYYVILILLATSLIVGFIGSFISVTKHLRWVR